MIPAREKMRANARSALVPNHDPKRATPVTLPIQGMRNSSANGPMRNAVMGEAVCSMLWASQKTRPCLSNGTTFWSTVCSHASAMGPMIIHMSMPIAVMTIYGILVKKIHIVHAIIFMRRSVRTGFFPRPSRAVIYPPMMNPILDHARRIPHVSTETSESP